MGVHQTRMSLNLFEIKHKLPIIMVGLEAAGKTTILNKLGLDEFHTTIPSKGNLSILKLLF